MNTVACMLGYYEAEGLQLVVVWHARNGMVVSKKLRSFFTTMKSSPLCFLLSDLSSHGAHAVAHEDSEMSEIDVGSRSCSPNPR